MVRSLALLLLSALLMNGMAIAQNHVNGYAAVGGTGAVYLVDMSGKTRSLQAGTSTAYGCVMGQLNSLLIVANLDGNLYEVDPQAGALVGTLATGLSSPRDIAVGSDGNYYVVNTSGVVWRVDMLGGATTITSVLGSSTYGGMDIDINSGDLLIQSATGSDPLFLVARDGSVVTTLGTGFDARYGITQHIRSGDVFSGTCCGDQGPTLGPENIYVLRAGQSIATVWLATAMAPVGVYSLKADRASAAQQQLILGSLGSTAVRGQGIYRVDMATKAINQVTTITTSLFETEILYRRNITSVGGGRGVWNIGIRIPEDPGLIYIMAVSAAGVRPGVPLSDGRVISLFPDKITVLGLTSGLAPFVTGTTGSLSPKGLASARLNLSSLSSAANGVLLYFEAVTLDPKAPNGIKTITDPHVIKVEGL